MSNILLQNRKDNWMVIKEQSELVKKAGLLPANVTAEMAVIMILKGQELGIGPMRAMEGLYVISGKVAMQASLVMGLIREKCPQAKFTVKRKDSKGCVIEATRPGQEMEVFQFLEQDAKTAGLTEKGPWKSYPTSMYWSRVVTLIGRQLFSDILGGASYTPEELGSDITEDDPETPIGPTKQPEPKPLAPKPIPETVSETIPLCKTCKAPMLVSKTGKHYYCANWQDGREHQPIKVGPKPKEREVEEQEQPFDENISFEDFN